MLPQTPSEASSLTRLQSLALCTAVVAVPLLLGLAGEKMRAVTRPEPTLQSFDASRQLLFLAQPDGSVRVLNLRNTVGEIASLRSTERHAVRALQLQANGRELLVQGDDANYRYDAHSLQLIERARPALALNEPATASASATVAH